MEDSSRVDAIHVVSSTDNNYAQHLCVTFTSLFMNMSPGVSIQLYVLCTGLTEENRHKLQKTISRFGAQIQFIMVDNTLYSGFHTNNHITSETYFRLSIPEVISSSVSKVIYLDSDVVVTGDIAEMWETDLKNHAIAAVSDLGGAFLCKELHIPEGVFFNAGILIMNLTKWREEAISTKAINYISKNTTKMVYHDQEALNALLYDDWLELSPKWNVHSHMVRSKEWKGSNAPGMIHYTGSSKPWHFDNVHPLKQEYYKYLQMTEWKSYRPEVNVNLVLRWVANKYVPKAARSWLKKVVMMR
jgi:lipopolysaccharide biosynthesis glycosyltransferase